MFVPAPTNIYGGGGDAHGLGFTQVAAVDDVTSTSQITDLYAKATERRRLATSGSTSALITYRLTITKLVTEELGSVEAFEQEYLDAVTTSLAAATADPFFIEILRVEPLFKDSVVDVGATYIHLKGATIEADPVEDNDQETASADSDAEPKTAGLPIVAAIVAGASLLGAATGAYIVSKYREAYQTERIAPKVFPVKDIDLETPPATLPANPALFARR